MTKAYEVAKSIPWAITEDSLRLILAIANREVFASNPVLENNPQAVEMETGTRLAGTEHVRLRGTTAIVPIYGPIVRRASLFSSFSGATSIEMIAKDLNAALISDEVESILFDIDSPGGEVNGCNELSDIVYNASRSKKKMWAYVGNHMCSGAYWIASGVEKIIASPTALIGSIGVLSILPDPSAESSDEVIFVSSQSPNKRADITKKEGRAQVQTVVDNLAAVFIATVARNRGVTVSTVENEFGKGDVFVGQYAVDAGLVDELGSLEGAIASLAESATSSSVEIKVSAEEEDLGFKEDVIKLLGMNDEEATVTDKVVEPTPTPVVEPTPTPTPITTASSFADSDEYKALQAENRRLRLVGYTARAEQYADAGILAGQAFPAERAALVQAYIQASFDDQTFGSIDANGASRVSILESMMASRPKNQLTEDQVNPAVMQIIRAPEKSLSEKSAPLTEDEVRRLAGMTSVGAQAVAGR